MKLFLHLIVYLAVILGAWFYMHSDAQALSVSNVKIRYCHFGGMQTKWGYNGKTLPWDAYWVCQADGSNDQSKITVYWEADQIDNNFRVEYSLDGKTYTSGLAVSMPLTQKYMWQFIASPSRTYQYRIRSTATGNTDLHIGTFRTNIAEGSVKYIEGFGIDFGVRYDGNKILKWETYNFSSGAGGGCQIGNLSLRSGNYSCPGTGGDRRLKGANNWFLEDKGTHIFVKTAGGMEIDDGDNDTSAANLTVYAPNLPPFIVSGVVEQPVSVTQEGDAVPFSVKVTDITGDDRVAPQNVQLSFPSDPAGFELRPGATSSCSGAMVAGGTCILGGTAKATLSAPLGPRQMKGLLNNREFTFVVNVEKPKPGIVIDSSQFTSPLLYRTAILQGVIPPSITFTLSNPRKGSTLNYDISDNSSWLSASPVTGTLTYDPNLNVAPSESVSISFAPGSLLVQSAPYTGIITIVDRNDRTVKAEIRVELTVTNTADFSLAVSAPSTLVQGNSVGAKITLTKTTGVSSDVTLSGSGFPAGVTGTFTPSWCAASTLALGSCTSILTLSAEETAAIGSKTITISAKKPADANGPARDQKKTFTLTISKSFGVSLALSPASLEVQSGRSGTVRVLATLSGEAGKDIKFAVDGLPGGASGTFTPASCVQTCTSSLTLQAGTAGSGTSSLAVKATGAGGKSATASLSFVIKARATATPRPTTSGKPSPTQIPVTPRPIPTGGVDPGENNPLEFSLVTVRTLSVIQGSMTNTSIILSYDRGDAEPVRLAVSQVPAGITTSLSLTQCVPSCYAVLTIRTTGKTQLGNSNIKITASTKDTSRTGFIELIVGTDPPPAPKTLLQKSVKDSTQVGVGGIVREDRITFEGMLDNTSTQKVRMRVEAKPVKEFFNGVTGVFEEPTRLIKKGSAYELTGSKLLGGYKWRAQAVDERGIASQWTEFGANTEGEPDFVTDLSTAPPNPFEGNQGDKLPVEEKPGFFRRIFGWVCYIPGIRRICN